MPLSNQGEAGAEGEPLDVRCGIRHSKSCEQMALGWSTMAVDKGQSGAISWKRVCPAAMVKSRRSVEVSRLVKRGFKQTCVYETIVAAALLLSSQCGAAARKAETHQACAQSLGLAG